MYLFLLLSINLLYENGINASIGNKYSSYSPTPPERGSFPLDHDHECSGIMTQYLNCLKLVQGNNAPNCRLLAKQYLGCRMDNELMDKDEWKNLGLPEDEKTEDKNSTKI